MRYTRPRMQLSTLPYKYWAAAGLSAALLELPFPLAGPLPPAGEPFGMVCPDSPVCAALVWQ